MNQNVSHSINRNIDQHINQRWLFRFIKDNDMSARYSEHGVMDRAVPPGLLLSATSRFVWLCL